MQIVIDIPEETANKIKDNVMFAGSLPSDIRWDVTSAIVNGTPLPKGHGKLVDTEELLNTFWEYCKQGDFGYHQAEDLIKSATPIIEADRGDTE